MNLSSLNDQEGLVGKAMSIPGNFVENGNNSPNTIIMGGSNIGGDAKLVDDKQTALITKLIEAQIALTEKVMALLEKR